MAGDAIAALIEEGASRFEAETSLSERAQRFDGVIGKFELILSTAAEETFKTRQAQFTRTEGWSVEITPEALSFALRSLCPIWPFC